MQAGNLAALAFGVGSFQCIKNVGHGLMATGAVRRSFVGEPTATDLWAELAELREPGSVPEGCTDH